MTTNIYNYISFLKMLPEIVYFVICEFVMFELLSGK